MRWKRLWVVLLVAGCGADEVPFDDLPLRDALRADPDVIAGLPPAARLRLGARLEAARFSDAVSDGVGDRTGAPATLVAALDRSREARLADPLIVGVIDGDGQARPFRETTSLDGAGVPMAGEQPPTTVTAALEAQALEGSAGAALRALAGASGAHRLRRVVGWPIGALAIGDTVYVNASWLVALAPGRDGVDGGADAAPAEARPAPSGGGRAKVAPTASPPLAGTGGPLLAPAELAASDGVRTAALTFADGGVDAGPSPPAPPPPPDQTADDCATACDGCATACASDSTYDSGDSCSSSDDGDACSDSGDDSGDACSDSSDDSGDACSDSGDDSADACSDTGDGADDCSSASEDGADCQVGHRRRRQGPTSHSSLLAPLGYLLLRRRR